MTRTFRALAVGCAATALVLGASAAPASAKTKSFTDKAGDAAAAFDITTVKVTNKKSAVVIKVTVPGLVKSKHDFVTVLVRSKGKGNNMASLVRLRLDGTAWSPAMLGDKSGKEIRCKGDKVTFRAKSITFRIPQRCLPKPRKAVKVGVAIGAADALNDPESGPKPGPSTTADFYPSSGNKLSPWVRYR